MFNWHPTDRGWGPFDHTGSHKAIKSFRSASSKRKLTRFKLVRCLHWYSELKSWKQLDIMRFPPDRRDVLRVEGRCVCGGVVVGGVGTLNKLLGRGFTVQLRMQPTVNVAHLVVHYRATFQDVWYLYCTKINGISGKKQINILLK